MDLNKDLSYEEFMESIYSNLDLKKWPDTCECCKKKITKTLFLRMHLILPELEENHEITGEEEITIVKESYCRKCSESIPSGMIVEVPLP